VRDKAGIVRIVQPHTMRVHGRVFWQDSGYVVEVKRTLGAARRAFTLGHEIAHTFFMTPNESTVSERVDVGTETFAEGNQEEYLCDVAAAEMLMPAAALLSRRKMCSPAEMMAPENAFLRGVVEYKPSARSILALACEFGTSLSATSRRFAEMDAWSCHIGFWKQTDDGRTEFQFGYTPKRTRIGIPKGFCANPLSIVSRVSMRRKCAEGWSNIGLIGQAGEPVGKTYVQSVPINDGRVLSVAVFERFPELLVAEFDRRRSKPSTQASLRFRKHLV
jgi:Zn-dependent peptidase ImmA (M78 family)